MPKKFLPFSHLLKKVLSLLERGELVVLLLIGGGVRFYRLTASSIWHDEGYSLWLTRFSWGEIVARTARDVHPPAYYLLLKLWQLLFGRGVFASRSLSVVFSLLTVAVVYFFLKAFFSGRSAWWGGLFLALSPFAVRFSQETRMYAMLAFLLAFASFLLAEYWRDQKRWLLVAYTALMIVACYTQYYGFFALLCHWVVGLFCLKKRKGVFPLPWWLANGAIALAYLPWLPIAYRQATRVSASYWIRPEWITKRTVFSTLMQFVSFSHYDNFRAWQYWLFALLLLVPLFPLLHSRRVKEDRSSWVASLALATLAFLPPLLVFAVSKVKTPIYQDRYFVFSASAFFALWGIFIGGIKPRWARLAGGALFVLLLARGNLTMHRQINHQMKRATAFIKSNLQEGDLVVARDLYSFLDSSYYFNYRDIKLLGDQVDGYGETSLFFREQSRYLLPPSDLAGSGKRVWMICNSGCDPFFGGETATFGSTTVALLY